MAELSVREYRVDDVVILNLTGMIIMGETSIALRRAMARLIEQGSRKVLMNLREVTFIDSSGLGALVACFATLKQAGGRLALLNVTPRIKDLMVLTKLLTVFDVYDDRMVALDAFKQTPGT